MARMFTKGYLFTRYRLLFEPRKKRAKNYLYNSDRGYDKECGGEN